MRKALATVFLLALPASAAGSPLRGPVSGFVLDGRSQTIRPVQGIPGASLLGPPLEIPFPVSRAAFSARAGFAVVVSAAQGRAVFLVRGLAEALPAAVSLAGVEPDPEGVVLNGADSAAALYWPAKRQMQVVSGLPGDAQAGPAIDLSALPGTVTAMAINAAGSCVLVGTSDPDNGSVFSVCPQPGDQPAPRLLARLGLPAALLYLDEDRDALVADRLWNEVVWIRDLHGAAQVGPLANGRDGVSTPVGLQLSADQRQLLVANSGAGGITVHELPGPSLAGRIPLPFSPTRLDRLNHEPVFLLNDIGAGPLFGLDEAGGRSVYFIPVD